MSKSLHLACGADNLDDLVECVQQGCLLDETDQNGETALHVATRAGNVRSVILLLKLGADIKAKISQTGHTALCLAFHSRQLLVSLVLIKAGALKQVYCPNVRVSPVHSADTEVDCNGDPALRLLSWVLSSNDGYRKREIYVSGKCDLALGVPLPKSKYSIDFPKKVEAESLLKYSIESVVSLTYSSGAVTSDGKAFTWGHGGRSGRLGHGSMISCPVPTLIRRLCGYKVEVLAGGDNHMLALCRESGTVFAWGDNTYGQLGYSTPDADSDKMYTTPRKIDFFVDLAVKHAISDGEQFVTHVAAGASHSMCAVFRQDRNICELYSWGNNELGQLGVRSANFSKNCLSHPTVIKFRNQFCSVCKLTAAGDNSLVSFKIIRSSTGVSALTDAELSFESINSESYDIYQWGSGVFAPFKINFSRSKRSMETEFKDSDSHQQRRYTNENGIISLCTYRELSAAAFCNGNVFFWTTPRAELNGKASIRFGPDRMGALEPFRLGMNRRVVSLSLTSDNAVCCLCSGEVVTYDIREFKNAGGKAIDDNSAILMNGFAKVVEVRATEDRVLAISSTFLPSYPYTRDKPAKPSIIITDDAESSDSEHSQSVMPPALSLTSLQELCEQALVRNVSVKNVGSLISVAKYLYLDRLLDFCTLFLSENLDLYLLHGRVQESFELFSEMENEVYLRFGNLLDNKKSAEKIKTKKMHISKVEPKNDVSPAVDPGCRIKDLPVEQSRVESKNSCDRTAAASTATNRRRNKFKPFETIDSTYNNHMTNEPVRAAVSSPWNKLLASECTMVGVRGSAIVSSTSRTPTVSSRKAGGSGIKNAIGTEKANSPTGAEADGPRSIKLFDCLEDALSVKNTPTKLAPWSKETIVRENNGESTRPPSFADLQKMDMQDCKFIASRGKTSRWYVNNRPRADSLCEVIRIQEAHEKLLLEQRTEEMEKIAALEAVKIFMAAEQKSMSSKYCKAGRKRRKPRTESL